jgi:hypothetical protein
MEANTIFQQVNNSASMDSSAIIKSLFEFAKLINQMSNDDLISFYQALTLLKKAQPITLFRKNLLRVNIEEVQRIIYQAMKTSLRNSDQNKAINASQTYSLKMRFENAVGHSMY